MKTKLCPGCKTEKAVTAFWHRRDRDGPASRCKPCSTAAQRDWRRKQPDYDKRRYQAVKVETRERHLVRKYGVTLKAYDAAQIMRLAQLSLDDKKRAKLATANETLMLYNRESGLGLDLGLDETDHGSDARPVPQAATAGKAVAADTLPQSGGTSGGDPAAAANQAVQRASVKPAPQTTYTGMDDKPDPIPTSESGGTPPPAGNAAPASRMADAAPLSGTDPDAHWQAKDGAASYDLGNHIRAGRVPVGEVDAERTAAVIARCADEVGPNTARMLDTIAECPTSPEVASLAIQTAQLVDMGRLSEASAIVAVVKAATGAVLEIPAHLRVGTEANRLARSGR